ncbi:MAG: glycerophosphodiester phosphodiesterase family protein [Halioglobus sp.]
MHDRLQNLAMKAVDGVMACIPQSVPDRLALANCKIISHRGEHDNVSVIENTLPAFEKARANGVWGIECDIRWTQDLVPVISHDACGSRLFGNASRISELKFPQLRAQMPLIPSLSELVDEFADNTHLMLEVKEEHYPQPQRQKEILQAQLVSLRPGLDFHFLALDPRVFEQVDFVPRAFCFPVSELNARHLSRLAIEQQWGGLYGHFLLLTNRVRMQHERAGQLTGTGFVSSRNCLFRELNRGVEWIFSNNAVRIQKIRDHYLGLQGGC